jgi:hypothetical protein
LFAPPLRDTGWGSQLATSQAARLAYIDDFLLVMALVVASLPLILRLRKPRPRPSPNKVDARRPLSPARG